VFFSETENTYSSVINRKLIEFSESQDYSAVFGQNIITGSRISGLGLNLETKSKFSAINTPNSESSLFGIGFGLAMNGVSAVFLMKQHDFALLGLDQLVNTYNLIRNRTLKSPFIVLMVVVDSGYEGPQSSLNNLDDFASLTRGKVHFLTTLENIDSSFNEIKSTGLHFLVVGQSQLKQKVVKSSGTFLAESNFTLYRENRINLSSNLFVNFGVNFEVLFRIIGKAENLSKHLDLMTCKTIGTDFDNQELEKMLLYKKIFIVDGSKSSNRFSEKLVGALEKLGHRDVHYYPRKYNVAWTSVFHDRHEVDENLILDLLV
jgi:hypothetical protein